MSDHLALNRASWDERVAAHVASPDYAVERFRSDPQFLSGVVQFDRPRLGDVAGLRGVHLQCHIGTDTISLARLGARMTGLDFSELALAQGRKLAAETGAEVEFVHSELYGAVDALGAGRFDLVFTGIGALCWLPDIDRWAGVVADLLAPGGRLFIREGHPMMWALQDDRQDDLLVVEYAYSERSEPLVYTEGGTYVETDATFEHNTTHSWNHGLGEIVSALLRRNMRITELVEHDSVPWEAFPGHMEKLDGGEFRIAERPWRVPHSYTLQAVKDGSRH